MNKSFSIGEAVRYGWKRVWANWQVLCGMTLGLYIINIIIQLLTKSVQNNLPAMFVFSVINALFALFSVAVVTRAAILEGKGEKATFKAIVRTDVKTYGRLILAIVLIGLVTLFIGLIGFLLVLASGNFPVFQGIVMLVCFVIFLIISVRLKLSTYLVVDGTKAVESISKSWKMTECLFWKLLGLSVLLALINIAGAIVVLVGLLVTVPLSLVAMGHVYHKLLAHHTAA